MSRWPPVPACPAPRAAKCAPGKKGGRAASFLLPRAGVNERSLGERERRILEAVSSLARSLQAERERLARRLGQLEQELDVLASRLDGEPALIAPALPRRS